MTNRYGLTRVGVALLALAVTTHAQSKPTPSPAPVKKPDFSGTWVFQRADDGRSGHGGSRGAFRLGMEFTVTQDDKTITVVGEATRGGALNSTYVLDGTPSGTLEYATSVSWDGSKLVIVTAGPPNRKQTWALDTTGSILTIQTMTAGIDQPTTVVYAKK